LVDVLKTENKKEV